MSSMKEVYLDYAAAAPLDSRVFKTIKEVFRDFGNPSSLHASGLRARKIIEKSRREILEILGDPAGKIIFTGSGTEANNLAILGISRAYKKFGDHIIVSKIEHPSVLNTAKQLEKEGFKVTYLDVDHDGIVSLKSLKKALQKNTILVSIMYANNEIGVIQPLNEIAKIINATRKTRIHSNYPKKNHSGHSDAFIIWDRFPLFHTDAVQAFNYLDCDVKKLGVDLLTLNGSKIYGPKGIGCLYLKSGVKLEPLMFGGEQEFGWRPGTENIPLIRGLAAAIILGEKIRPKEAKRLTVLRDWLIKKIEAKIPKIHLNGHRKNRLPNNINFSFADIEGESLILRLDAKGIRTSSGSACTSERLEPSHVLLALGLPPEIAHGSLRITLGRGTTKKDLEYFIRVLPKVVEELRQLSPIKLKRKYLK